MSASGGPRDAEGLELLASQDEVRAMDRLAIGGGWGVTGPADTLGVTGARGTASAPPLPGRVLMELAGAGAARLVRERAGGLAGKAVVLCGPGNNGGDGWVVARHLHAAGWAVRCIALGEPAAGTDAAVNLALWNALGGEIRVAERGATARMKNWLGHANAIVDALFGTGLGRSLEGAAAELVAAANEAEHGLRVALDVPSGLHADRGEVLGVAFRGDLTATFGVKKLGLYLGQGPAHSGEVAVVDIAWPPPVVTAIGASARLATAEAMSAIVPARPADGHKGTFGHVGVVGGFPGTEGAAVLAAIAALRSGAGLSTWSAPEAPEPVMRPPEIMRHAFADALPPRPNALVVGPGLGIDARAERAVALALDDTRPSVWDADALNLVAREGRLAALGGERVLTPHPLEAARLIGSDASTVQADRLGAAARLATTSGAVVVLKGRNPIVAAPGHAPVVFDLSEPTLAVGGSGDVLAGLIGGLLAQGLAPRAAALLGVYVHGQAGADCGLGRAQRGALASEIADAVPAVLERLSPSR